MNDLKNLQSRYAGLIFDCDGTLTDSMPVHYVAWVTTLSKYGINFPESRFYELGGVPTNKIIDLLAAEQGVVVDSNAIAHEKELAFLEQLSSVGPNEPVCQVAREHHGSVPMAVASGGVRQVVIDQLNSIRMLHVFDAIVGAEDTELHKPNPDVFLEAARRLNVPAHQCVVFEDTDIGIQAARSAGMDYVDVRQLQLGVQSGRRTGCNV